MGQKVNPIGFRVSVTKDWRSRWFARKREFGDMLHEDLKMRQFVQTQLSQAAVSRIQIERFASRIRLTIHTARPGMVFGRKRAEYDALKNSLFKLLGTKDNDVYVDVVEVRYPELEAQLVAQNVAMQLERRVGFRRAMKKALQTSMDMGAVGIKIRCAGRLGGAELARTEEYRDGKVPLHTLRADVQYGFCESVTTAGLIGVKVWLCRPDNMEEKNNAFDAKKGKASQGSKRKNSRQRDQR
ncbi:MAG TPA: 30S ribosomal protein S3 [Lentisphaeria bacterium]|nr:30S ribosomal protein S3 [Lentisphaeria bacterium]